MTDLLRKIGRHNKAFVVLAAFGLALGAQAAGVDVGLSVEDTWMAVVAAVGVWLVPNKEN